MTDLLVIANGRRQLGRHARGWDRVVGRLREVFGNSVEVRYTTGRGDGKRLAREALLAGAGWLAAAGGDGTIHDVVNGFFEKGCNIQPKSALSFLPCGRGNDWVRTLALPSTLFEAVEALARARLHQVDVGHACFRDLEGVDKEEVFLNIAEGGLGAKVLENMGGRPGSIRLRYAYLLGALAAALSYPPRRLQLILDGSTGIATEPLLSLIAANGRYFGAGMHCAPMARPDDGLLEVICVGNFRKAEVFLNFSDFVRGDYLNKPKVHHYSVASIDLSSGEKVPLELDGEVVGSLPATLRLLPQALQLRY